MRTLGECGVWIVDRATTATKAKPQKDREDEGKVLFGIVVFGIGFISKSTFPQPPGVRLTYVWVAAKLYGPIASISTQHSGP